MGPIIRALTSLTVQNSRLTRPSSTRTSVGVSIFDRRVMKSTPDLYRNWSVHAPLVRTCIDIRLGQLMLAEWDLVPFDRTEKQPDKGLMRRVREIFEEPNPSGESFGSLMGAVGEDLLVLDAGAIEKERSYDGEIYALWPTDGGRIGVNRYWDGSPNDTRYYWVPQPNVEIGLRNRDLIYMMMHKRTYQPVGISYLEILRSAIEAELNGSWFNARQISQAAPDGIMDLGENIRPEQVTAFRSFFEQEIAGRGMIGFWGGTKNAKFIPFRGSNREAQFIEFLTWEARKIPVAFQLSIQDIGLLNDVNRANAEVQQQNSEDRGQRVLLGNVQDYLTTEVVWDKPFGGKSNNIAFRFLAVSDRTSLMRAQELKIALAGMPYESINGGRMSLGLQPIGDPLDQNNPFNKLMANTSLGIATIDLVPNARELAAKNKPDPGDGGGDGAPKQLGDGKKAAIDKAYEIITTHPAPDLDSIAEVVESKLSAQMSLIPAPPVPTVLDPAEIVAGLSAATQPERDEVKEILTRSANYEDRLFQLAERSDQRFADMVGQLADLAKAFAARPVEVTIAEGAIQNPVTMTIEKGALQVDSPVTVESAKKPERLVRETTFQTDADGRIIGKREVENPEGDDVQDG